MAASLPASSSIPLECSASAGSGDWQLQVKFSNDSNQSFAILRWHSPLDAWFSEFLQLSQHEKQLPYQGAKAKRLQPAAEDLLVLAPGQSHVELLDLTQAYEIDNAPLKIEFSPIAVMTLKPGAPLVWQSAQQQWLSCADMVMIPATSN